jgi:phosphoketolase
MAADKQQNFRRLWRSKNFIRRYGEDLPEIRDWTWTEPIGRQT